MAGFHNVDHYKCYKAKVSKGTSPFTPVLGVVVDGQFTDGDRVFDLKKPTRLCTPADKNGEGIKDESTLLMCYQAKAVKGLCAAGAPTNAGGVCANEQHCGGTKGQTTFCELQPTLQKISGVFVNNQFGPEQIDVTKEEELCVPSTVGSPG